MPSSRKQLPAGARARLGSLTWRAPTNAHSLVISPDGRYVAAAGEEIVVWHADTGHVAWREDSDAKALLRFSPDSDKLAIVMEKRLRVLTVGQWGASSAYPGAWALGQRVELGVTWSEDGQSLLLEYETLEHGEAPLTARRLAVFRFDGTRCHAIPGHFPHMQGAALLADDRIVYLQVTGESRLDAAASLVHLDRQGRELGRWDIAGENAMAPSLSANGRFAICCFNDRCEVWSAVDGLRLQSYLLGSLKLNAIVSDDGSMSLVDSFDRIRAWDTATGTVSADLQRGKPAFLNGKLCLSSDGRRASWLGEHGNVVVAGLRLQGERVGHISDRVIAAVTAPRASERLLLGTSCGEVVALAAGSPQLCPEASTSVPIVQLAALNSQGLLVARDATGGLHVTVGKGAPEEVREPAWGAEDLVEDPQGRWIVAVASRVLYLLTATAQWEVRLPFRVRPARDVMAFSPSGLCFFLIREDGHPCVVASAQLSQAGVLEVRGEPGNPDSGVPVGAQLSWVDEYTVEVLDGDGVVHQLFREDDGDWFRSTSKNLHCRTPNPHLTILGLLDGPTRLVRHDPWNSAIIVTQPGASTPQVTLTLEPAPATAAALRQVDSSVIWTTSRGDVFRAGLDGVCASPFPAAPVTAMLQLPGRDVIVVATRDNMTVWSTDGRLRRVLDANCQVRDLRIASAGAQFVCEERELGTVRRRIWSAASLVVDEADRWPGSINVVESATVSPDGQHLAGVEVDYAKTPQGKRLDIRITVRRRGSSQAVTTTFSGVGAPVEQAPIFIGDRAALVGPIDAKVYHCTWDERMLRLDVQPLEYSDFRSMWDCGQLPFILVRRTHGIEVRDRASLKVIHRITVPDETIEAATISADSEWLAIGTPRGEVLVYGTRVTSEFSLKDGHREGITALAFLDDGSLVSGSADCTCVIWHPRWRDQGRGASQRRRGKPSSVKSAGPQGDLFVGET